MARLDTNPETFRPAFITTDLNESVALTESGIVGTVKIRRTTGPIVLFSIFSYAPSACPLKEADEKKLLAFWDEIRRREYHRAGIENVRVDNFYDGAAVFEARGK